MEEHANTNVAVKKHTYIILCLFVRIVIAWFLYGVIKDEWAIRPFIRFADLIIFLLIALEYSRITLNKEEIEGDFPRIMFLISGILLIIECLVDYPEWIITIAVYISSLVVFIRTMLRSGKPQTVKIQFSYHYLIVLFFTIAYWALYEIFVNPFFRVYDLYNLYNYTVENFDILYWIRLMSLFFTHGGVIEELVFR